jgi:hypothetical protein
MSYRNSELVSHGANGLDLISKFGGVVQLSAQTAHVHIETAIEGVESPVQHHLGQVLSSKDLTRIAHQRPQQLELHVGQVEFHPVAGCRPRAAVELDSTNTKVLDGRNGPGNSLPIGGRSPQDCPDSRQ